MPLRIPTDVKEKASVKIKNSIIKCHNNHNISSIDASSCKFLTMVIVPIITSEKVVNPKMVDKVDKTKCLTVTILHGNVRE